MQPVLEKLVGQNKLDATRVFNADETGLSTSQKRARKVSFHRKVSTRRVPFLVENKEL
jgi:hypothetical protein